MSEHQVETVFLRRLILYTGCEEPLKLEKSIAQVLHDARCVQRCAWAMALFLLLGCAGVVFGVILDENFPYNVPQPVVHAFCDLFLASLICLMTFVGLLVLYRIKLNRLRGECRNLLRAFLEAHLGDPQIPALAAAAFQVPPPARPSFPQDTP